MSYDRNLEIKYYYQVGCELDPKGNNHNRKCDSGRPFFQKQKAQDSSCRMHALNNAMGRAALSPNKFFNLCDEFDRHHGTSGSRDFFFLPSEHPEDNLLSFILHRHGYQTKLVTAEERKTGRQELQRRNRKKREAEVATVNRKDEEDEEDGEEEEEQEQEQEQEDWITALQEDCCAVLCFSDGHVWAYRRSEGSNAWWCLDSLERQPRHVKLSKVYGQSNVGLILVRKKEKRQKHKKSIGGEKGRRGKSCSAVANTKEEDDSNNKKEVDEKRETQKKGREYEDEDWT
ncbi:Claspin [Balamuthia mandrillaris]